jgi:hypothetical protein
MTGRRLSLALAVLVFIMISLLWTFAKTEFFNIEEVRPGMRGIGKTCYQGTNPEEFQVEVLGVLHGVNPGASAILARLSGGSLDKTGVFEGMSGSPVFIDGKLLGAVAFSYPYAKEAICGITPINQMVSAFEEQSVPPSGIKIVAGQRIFRDYALPLPGYRVKSKESTVASNAMEEGNALGAFGGHALIPIATPLSMGGLDASTLKVFAPQFRALGMSFLQGAGGASAKAKSGKDSEKIPLEPGSNIVVSLISGDLDISAGGTVTYVDGNKLYAFGHNLLELGFTELPMHNARAILVFPSMESSFKILETGELAGAIRQDRGSGIFGVIGEKPRLIPLQVHLSSSRGSKRDYKYELAKDPFLTPILVDLAVYNTIVSSERAQGTSTLNVKGKISIKNEQAVEVHNRFSSDASAPSSASISIAAPVNYLMVAGYKNLDIENIDVDISSQESDQTAILDSIRVNSSEAKAGDSLELEVSYKQANGEVMQDSYPVKIPASIAPGALYLLVADGTTIMSIDEQEEDKSLVPRDLSQLIRFINNIRKNDRLYVRLFRQEPGAVVKGEGLPGLPPSILSILRSERRAGALTPIRTSTFMEYELQATDYVITGSQALKIKIKP